MGARLSASQYASEDASGMGRMGVLRRDYKMDGVGLRDGLGATCYLCGFRCELVRGEFSVWISV